MSLSLTRPALEPSAGPQGPLTLVVRLPSHPSLTKEANETRNFSLQRHLPLQLPSRQVVYTTDRPLKQKQLGVAVLLVAFSMIFAEDTWKVPAFFFRDSLPQHSLISFFFFYYYYSMNRLSTEQTGLPWTTFFVSEETTLVRPEPSPLARHHDELPIERGTHFPYLQVNMLHAGFLLLSPIREACEKTW